MYLGLKCEEGGNEPSETHLALRNHTERLGNSGYLRAMSKWVTTADSTSYDLALYAHC